MKLTPKQKVLKKWPKAELARDGWDERAGISGVFDYAIFSSPSKSAYFLGQGPTPQTAWDEAARRMK